MSLTFLARQLIDGLINIPAPMFMFKYSPTGIFNQIKISGLSVESIVYSGSNKKLSFLLPIKISSLPKYYQEVINKIREDKKGVQFKELENILEKRERLEVQPHKIRLITHQK